MRIASEAQSNQNENYSNTDRTPLKMGDESNPNQNDNFFCFDERASQSSS